MAITITIKIDKIETVNLDNFEKYVVAVGYTITGTEGDKSYSLSVCNNIVEYDPENPPSVNTSGLLSYQDLTEEKVKEWIVAQPVHNNYVLSVQQNEAFAPVEPQPDEPALPW